MADVRVDVQFLGSLLFPGLMARITGARFDGENSIFLTLEGPDVPRNCTEVLAIITQRSVSVHLEPVQPIAERLTS